MLDFECVVNPYLTYATDRDWAGDVLADALAARLTKTLAVHRELAALLQPRRYRSEWEI